MESSAAGNIAVAAATEGEKMQAEWQCKLSISEDRIEELSKRIEEMQSRHQEELLAQEKELNIRVFESMQDHLDTARTAEADLLQ